MSKQHSLDECIKLLTDNYISEVDIIKKLGSKDKLVYIDEQFIKKNFLEVPYKLKKNILVAIQLRQRLIELEFENPISYLKPELIFKLLFEDMRFLEKEHFIGLYFNANMNLQDKVLINIGSVDAIYVHPRDIFRPAVINNSSAVIIAHNHPSGDPTPGPKDISLTNRMIEIGKLLGIQVIDHVVIGKNKYISMANESLVKFN